MSYRMIHAARRLMCDKFSILCTIAELNDKQLKEDEGMRIRIKKVRDDIPTPSYAYKGDAGYDLICAEDVIVEPGQTVKIPTGLAFEIAEGYELQIRPRSGVTSKTKLRVQLGTVDSNYRGEVSVIVDNIEEQGTEYDYRIKTIDGKGVDIEPSYDYNSYLIRKGDRIAQGVITPVVQAQFKVVDELGETDRGTGGFGSSGVKSEKYEQLSFDFEEDK